MHHKLPAQLDKTQLGAQVNTQRLENFVRRLFSAKERQIVPTIHPQVGVQVIHENDRPEHKYISDEKLYSKSSSITGDATHASQAYLVNPAGSGVLCVLEAFVVVNATASNDLLFGLIQGDPGFSAPVTGVVRDTRLAAGGPVVAAVSSCGVEESGTAAAQPVTASFRPLTVSPQAWFLPVPFVLSPGYAVGFVGTVVTQRLVYTFAWRERVLEPSED